MPYTPKHRRKSFAPLMTAVPDPLSQARCECHTGGVDCCPRHDPEGYAEHMAKHAPDSDPIDLDSGIFRPEVWQR